MVGLRPSIFWDSLKFTFLKVSLLLILLYEFFMHKIIHSLKDRRPHEPFFQNSVSWGRRMRTTFLFSFSILWEVANSWLMLAYIGQKKKFSKIILLSTEQRSVIRPQPWYSEILRYNKFFKSFQKAGPMFLKTSLVASFPFHTKRLELLSFFFFRESNGYLHLLSGYSHQEFN